MQEGFRKAEIFTIAVDDVFKANMKVVEAAYLKYKDLKEKTLVMSGLKKMLQDVEITLPDRTFFELFHYSKMTLQDEMQATSPPLRVLPARNLMF